MSDIERVISTITIEQLRGETRKSAWIARAMVADLDCEAVAGRSYAASGNTPAKALHYLKEAVKHGEKGWTW